MASKKQLLDAKRKELLAAGYKPGIVQLSLDWAVGCADGNAAYYQKQGVSNDMSVELLPAFLNDCEKWIQSIAGKPGES